MKHHFRNRIVSNSIVIIFVLGLVTLYTTLSTMELVKSVQILFSKNMLLKIIEEQLKETQQNLTEYLQAKNSESLKEYIKTSSRLLEFQNQLNRDVRDDKLLLLERDLLLLIENYLTYSEQAVQAKRGRDVNTYVAAYEETKRSENSITFILEKLNSLYLEQALQSFSKYEQNMGLIASLNLLLILISFILSTTFTLRYSHIITEPLEKLSSAVEAISRGAYDIEIDIYKGDDEIGTLNQAFRNMQRSILEAFEELRNKAELERQLFEQQMQVLDYQHKLKDAELLALQSQINPHFLYNTLSAGWQLALSQEDEITAEFLEKLADFIRYALKPTNRMVLVSEEVDCAQKYIWLLKLRFKNRYTFEVQVDETSLARESPAMILQPLIENAITHGLHDVEQGGTVSIRVWTERDMVQYEVRDTGKGMDQTTIEEALAAAQGEGVLSYDHIGLHNVIRRLHLYTGGKESITIESAPDKGTRIVISIPQEILS
ncbi:MAG: histidine kinase [Treponemataceae bacterium]|nr:histidine kinase [Treponemataceae bacterium]